MLRHARWLALLGLITAATTGCSLDRSGTTPLLDDRDARGTPPDGTVGALDFALPDLASPDAGPPDDADAIDAMPGPDTAFDAEPPDAADAAALDLGGDVLDPADAATPDAGPLDAGPMDAGPMDAGPTDAGPPPDLGPDDACARLAPPSTVFLADERSELVGGYLSYVTVEEPAQIELERDRHRYGALLGIGYAAALVDDDYSFEEVAAGTPTGSRLVTTFDSTFSGGTPAPPFLGLPGDGHTLELRGEIRLARGMWRFELDADDRGVLQISVDGTVVELRNATPEPVSIGSVSVATDGWYPIRFAFSDSTGNSGYRIRAARDAAGFTVLTPSMMRFDASAIAGRDMHGFDAIMPTGLPDGNRFDTDPTEVDWDRGAPAQVGIGNGDDWSVRWAGRWFFPAPDASLVVISDDVHRLWIDGLCYGGAYDGTSVTTTYETRVPSGWHDVILEMTERSTSAHITARLAGFRFDLPAMRVAPRFGGHVATRLMTGIRTFAAGTTAHVDLDIDESRPGLVAAEISMIFDATTTLDDVVVVVVAPGGGRRTWPAAANAVPFGIGRWGLRVVWTGMGLPANADGRWTIDVSGTGARTGTLATAGIVAHSEGVAAPYATLGTWESVAIDLGGLSRLETLTAGFDARFGAGVRTEVRWASSVAALAGAPWFSVVPGSAVPGAPIDGFAQVRVVLTGPGTETPRVWSVGLSASRCIP